MPMLLYSSSLPLKVRDAVGLPTRCRQLPTCRRLVLVARRNCCCARCIAASEDGISAAETHADLVEHAARVENLPVRSCHSSSESGR